MRKNKKTITRRDFLQVSAYATLAMAMDARGEEKKKVGGVKRAKVVLVRDEAAIAKNGEINTTVIQKMLDDAVTSLLGKEDPVEAWKLLVKPEDVVGVKSNVWRYLPTPKEIEQAIKKRIKDAGVPEQNIGIDDRGVLKNPIFKKSTALINVRPFRTHHWAGVGGCLKNYIMFVKFPPLYHGNSCASLAKIWSLPIVKDKTRLNVLVLLQPLFYGIGPHHYDPTYSWNYKGILVGTDPVALDAVGVHLLKAKRLDYFKEDRPMKPSPRHVVFADTKYDLGTSDLKNIELVKLGWKEGILIT